MDQFLDQETDNKNISFWIQKLTFFVIFFMDPETDIMDHFLGPETDIMGEGNRMI